MLCIKLLAAVLCCQFSVSVESVPVFSVTVDSPAVLPAESPKTVSPDPPSQASRRYLAMFTASWCGPCQDWKRNVLPQLKAAGYHVQLIDMDLPGSQKYKSKVSRYPSFVVCDWNTGKWLSGVTTGGISVSTAQQMLGTVSVPVQVHRVQSQNIADQPGNYTEAERQKNIEHLLTHRTHVGKFTREYLESLSGYQLIDLHNADHGVPTVKGVKTGIPVAVSSVSAPVRYVSSEVSGRYVVYGGATYDMETWTRMCSLRNCGMCQYLDSMRAQYLANKAAMNSPQSSSSPDVVDEAIEIMQLTSSDVVAELGCGDGKAAIQMVKRSGCRVEGYEIDPQKVAEARRNVADAGLSHRITIHETDVVGLKLPDSTTAVYAFLYPELLAKIRPQLMAGRVAVCPGHKAEGIDMQLVGQCWVRKNI